MAEMGLNTFLNRYTGKREEFEIDTEEAVHDIFQNLEIFRDYLKSEAEEKILLNVEYGSCFERGMKHHMMIINYLDLWKLEENDEAWKSYCEILNKRLLGVHEKFADQFLADVFFYNIWTVLLIEGYEDEWLEDYLK